jgi:putative membrane protein insertion efficiency factor
MLKILIKIIDIYQKIPIKSHYSCVFIPTCSQYTKEALLKYGILRGLFLGFKRILNCHPWQKNKYDPVP